MWFKSHNKINCLVMVWEVTKSTLLKVKGAIGLLISCLLLVLMQQNAFASAQTGFVVGMDIGADIPAGHSENEYGDDYKRAAYNLGIILGYDYAINNKISLGVEAVPNTGGLNASSAGIGYLPIMLTTKFYPFKNGFNMFAKVGVAYLYGSGTFLEAAAKDISRSWQPTFAIGTGYQYKRINFYVQYQYTQMNIAYKGSNFLSPEDYYKESYNGALNSILVGVAYTF
ncbi:outer membrane protein [Cysteiniphilum litorale]|uniref:outer membrane protein n=1 Tax=Cysteiniphilum litorale TaxID=2056700 RepID=UPI003F88393B